MKPVRASKHVILRFNTPSAAITPTSTLTSSPGWPSVGSSASQWAPLNTLMLPTQPGIQVQMHILL